MGCSHISTSTHLYSLLNYCLQWITEDTRAALGRESKFLRFNILPCGARSGLLTLCTHQPRLAEGGGVCVCTVRRRRRSCCCLPLPPQPLTPPSMDTHPPAHHMLGNSAGMNGVGPGAMAAIYPLPHEAGTGASSSSAASVASMALA